MKNPFLDGATSATFELDGIVKKNDSSLDTIPLSSQSQYPPPILQWK